VSSWWISSVLLASAVLGACAPSEPAATSQPAPRLASNPISSSGASRAVRLTLESTATDSGRSPFWLGALLVPPAGAHLYWINPGETGLATTAEFEVPRGYQSSAVQYPGPVSFRSERGAVSYGYAGAVALLVRVTPEVADRAATFRVRASWLSCDEICVQERGEAEFTIGPEYAGGTLQPFIERLPAAGDAIAVERIAARELLLHPPSGVTLLEYFPLAPLGLYESAPTSLAQSDGSLRVQLENDRPLRGVVRASVRGQTRYFEIGESPASVERAQPETQ
jgi:thiol:disulfide interchange protein DsbD